MLYYRDVNRAYGPFATEAIAHEHMAEVGIVNPLPLTTEPIEGAVAPSPEFLAMVAADQTEATQVAARLKAAEQVVQRVLYEADRLVDRARKSRPKGDAFHETEMNGRIDGIEDLLRACGFLQNASPAIKAARVVRRAMR